MRVLRRNVRRRRRSGAAAVELAVMLPVFFALIFAQAEAARVGEVSQLLTVAARSAARTAVISGKTQADVQAAATAVLRGSGITLGTITPSPSNWSSSSYGSPITVTLSVPYRQVSWVPNPRYFGNSIISASATLNSERP